MKTRGQLPHLFYPEPTMQRRQINSYAFPSGIALVASDSANGTSSGATTSGINTTGASLLVVGISYQGSPTVSDSKGNTWTALTAYGGTNLARLYYCASPTVGTGHTFTVSGSNIFAPICAVALAGAGAAPFVSQTGNYLASSTTIQPGSISPTGSVAMVTALSAASNVGASTIDSSFDELCDFSFAGGVTYGLAMALKITAASENPTWSAGVLRSMGATMASFKT